MVSAPPHADGWSLPHRRADELERARSAARAAEDGAAAARSELAARDEDAHLNRRRLRALLGAAASAADGHAAVAAAKAEADKRAAELAGLVDDVTAFLGGRWGSRVP